MECEYFILQLYEIHLDKYTISYLGRIFKLVMECQSNELSEYQWCQENSITLGIFYNWIARFRKKGYSNILNLTGRMSKHKVVKQEAVQLHALPDTLLAVIPFQSCEFTSAAGYTGELQL